MSTQNGKTYSDIKNLNLRGGSLGSGLLKWQQYPGSNGGYNNQNWAANPYSSTEVGIYINTAGNLVYSYLGTATVLGGGGGGGIPTWNNIFANTQTLSVQGTAFTIQDTTGTSNNVLDLAASSTSGALLNFAQSGSGLDVSGTSASWTVSKAGAATFLSVASATVNGAGAGITIGDSGSNVVTIGTNTNTIVLAKATTFSSTITGVSASLVSTSNTVVPLLITDNTITTFGHQVASGGILVAQSTSITTGTVIRSQVAEGSLTTGFYFEAWDTTGSATSFSVGAKGATTIAGSAFATAALTLTAGDAVITSGKLLVTSADNTASSVVITDNSKLAHTLLALAGSGTFTGSTTTSFVTITPSGLTSGTALYMPLAAMTTGTGLTIVANALTTGKAISVAHTTSVIASGGTLLNLSSTSIDTATTSGVLVNLSSTASTAGTQILGTFSALTTGIGMSLVVAGLTTGAAISITANALTSGNGLIITSSSADTTARGLIQLTGSSASATGTAAIRATMSKQSTHFVRLMTESTTGVTLWLSDGTTAQGNLTGTTGDICFNGGSNKPEYCTGTTSWTALV